MDTVVQKYGGSSLADIEKIRKIAEYVVETAKKKRVVVVVSAMGKETDRLIDLAHQAFGGFPPKDEADKLITTGEEQSASLLALAIRGLDQDAISLTGWQMRIEADVNGRVKRVGRLHVVNNLLEQGKVVVVAGFQGTLGKSDRVVTLGRGSSDKTTVVVAAALGLDVCEIYTDVDGIYTVDPKIVLKARQFERISYSQMIQLSSAGIGKPQDEALVLAQNLRVSIEVLLSPSLGVGNGGTLICSEGSLDDMETSWYQAGIAIQRAKQIKIANVLNDTKIITKVFDALSGINLVDSIHAPRRKKADILILCSKEDLPKVLLGLEDLREQELFQYIKILDSIDVAELTLVDPLMKNEPGYLSRVFKSLSRTEVSSEYVSSSGTSISVVVREEDLFKTAQALAEEFNLLNE